MEHYFTNNTDLKSEMREIKYKCLNQEFVFVSDNGVFSKNHIDFGTKLLIETYLTQNNKPLNILDVGCGYGVIGIVLSKITNSHSTLVDINKRSVHLTKINIEKNKTNSKVFYSDVYENVKGKFDIIITNPPIRVGKNKVLEILVKAKEFLKKDGQLWCVIRKDQGAKSFVKYLEKEYSVEIVTKSKGFYIIKAKNN